MAAKKIQFRGTLSPTLAAGAFIVTFPDLAVITHALIGQVVYLNTADYVYQCHINTIVGNIVTVHVLKSILTGAAGTGTWGDAVTADVNGTLFEVIAEGI